MAIFKRLVFLSILAMGVFVGSNVFAFEEWNIQSFHSDIDLQSDGSMIVSETIVVNFLEERRGIFREIPTIYYDEYRQSKSSEIEVLDVKKSNGEEWEYVATDFYSYINIRIGNPDIYLTGEQTYVITYFVKDSIGFYGDHDEIYWDVTGNDWYVPIYKTSATLHLPTGEVPELKTRCFTGDFGSTSEDCSIVQNGSTVDFSANDFLTILVGFDKGIVLEPTAYQKGSRFLKNNYGYSFPIVIFLIMYLWWRKFGDDPDDPPGLVTQFEPPENLTPAEVGYLMHQKLKKSFLPAELVNLASKGYIHIKEIRSKKSKKSDNYTLIKKKDFDDPNLKEHEKMILKGIFLKATERKVTSIPTSFYYKVTDIKKEIYKQLKAKKYFSSNPQRVKGSYMAFSIFVILSSFATLGAKHIHFFVGVLLSGLVLLLFSFIMPKKTKRGVMALEHADGFKQYIDIAENRRIKWEEGQNLFFQFLPYAMVFGSAEKWARAFKDVFKEIPEWYEGDDLGALGIMQFTRTMNLFSTTTRSSIRPPASSGGSSYSRSSTSSFSSSSSGFSSGGGGGFSGGGGGGGGGGSW